MAPPEVLKRLSHSPYFSLGHPLAKRWSHFQSAGNNIEIVRAHHRNRVVGGSWGRISTGLAGVGRNSHAPVLSVLLVEGSSTAAQHDEQKIKDGLDDEACRTVHTSLQPPPLACCHRQCVERFV